QLRQRWSTATCFSIWRTPLFEGLVQVERGTGATDRPSRDGNYGHFTLKLTFPRNPNGVYLLKGGGPGVCRTFAVPRCWRKPQRVIHGKRCGGTENIGEAARVD